MNIYFKEYENSTTQALTEVALALSMAFFALLILALISMGVPEKPKNEAKVTKAKTIYISKENLAKEKIKADALNYIIFYQGSFYDEKLNKINANHFDQQDKLILAIQSTLSISEVITLKSQINRPNLSITTLNSQWISRLEEM